MGGFFSSECQDPEMLKLATQYKVPLQDAQLLTEHFRSLDRDGEGFFTRNHPALAKLEEESVNPLINKVITALFYPPHSLDPYEKPGERVDLERMFAVSALFLQHTWVDWLKQCNPFSKNNEVQTKQAGEKKKMRLIFLFRVFKDPEEPFISGSALEAIVHITNKYYLTDVAKHAVYEEILAEMGKITGREGLLREQKIEFADFRLICNHFAIDHVFTEEVRTG